MNKILMGILAVLVIGLMAGMASAVVPLTLVSGKVVDAGNVAVESANVAVTCTHNDVDTTKDVVTDASGMYYAFFGSTECNTGDSVKVQTEGSDDQTGIVGFDAKCKINTLKINLQIPEFGVMAGAVALLAGIGIIAYRRK